LFYPISSSCLLATSLFSKFFIILRNSSKLMCPFGSKSSSSRRSIASYGSLPSDFMMV
jgi:hypothetical protein